MTSRLSSEDVLAAHAARTADAEIAAQSSAKARPHPGRWVASLVVFVLMAQFVHSLVTTGTYQWRVVAKYFFNSQVMSGLVLTIELTAAVMVLGLAVGLVLATMRLSRNPVLLAVSWAYAWVGRGLPALVVLIFVFNIAALYPRLSVGIPFGPTFAHFNANTTITPLVAAILGLGLVEAAYMSEVFRAGIMSVPSGQVEAAASLGMSSRRAFWRIVLPQAMPFIIPPIGNSVIGMLKYTSLVSVITLADLLFSVEQIYALNYNAIPLLIVASLWYLVVTSVLMVGQYFIERHYARGRK